MKTPHTDFRVSGDVPEWLVRELKRRYGTNLKLRDSKDDNEELVTVRNTDWYREMKATETPGRNLRLSRLNRGLSQANLAKLLGPSFRKQHVSNMETGLRPISKAVAKQLAAIFQCPVGRFI